MPWLLANSRFCLLLLALLVLANSFTVKCGSSSLDTYKIDAATYIEYTEVEHYQWSLTPLMPIDALAKSLCGYLWPDSPATKLKNFHQNYEIHLFENISRSFNQEMYLPTIFYSVLALLLLLSLVTFIFVLANSLTNKKRGAFQKQLFQKIDSCKLPYNSLNLCIAIFAIMSVIYSHFLLLSMKEIRGSLLVARNESSMPIIDNADMLLLKNKGTQLILNGFDESSIAGTKTKLHDALNTLEHRISEYFQNVRPELVDWLKPRKKILYNAKIASVTTYCKLVIAAESLTHFRILTKAAGVPEIKLQTNITATKCHHDLLTMKRDLELAMKSFENEMGTDKFSLQIKNEYSILHNYSLSVIESVHNELKYKVEQIWKIAFLPFSNKIWNSETEFFKKVASFQNNLSYLANSILYENENNVEIIMSYSLLVLFYTTVALILPRFSCSRKAIPTFYRIFVANTPFLFAVFYFQLQISNFTTELCKQSVEPPPRNESDSTLFTDMRKAMLSVTDRNTVVDKNMPSIRKKMLKAMKKALSKVHQQYVTNENYCSIRHQLGIKGKDMNRLREIQYLKNFIDDYNALVNSSNPPFTQSILDTVLRLNSTQTKWDPVKQLESMYQKRLIKKKTFMKNHSKSCRTPETENLWSTDTDAAASSRSEQLSSTVASTALSDRHQSNTHIRFRESSQSCSDSSGQHGQNCFSSGSPGTSSQSRRQRRSASRRRSKMSNLEHQMENHAEHIDEACELYKSITSAENELSYTETALIEAKKYFAQFKGRMDQLQSEISRANAINEKYYERQKAITESELEIERKVDEYYAQLEKSIIKNLNDALLMLENHDMAVRQCDDLVDGLANAVSVACNVSRNAISGSALSLFLAALCHVALITLLSFSKRV